MDTMVVNPDLARERMNPSFDREKLTNLLNGGPAATARRRELTACVVKDCREENGPRFYFMSDSDKYDDAVRRSVYLSRKVKELQLSNFDENMWIRNLVFPNDTGPFMLHDGMFVPAIQQQATDAQINQWLPQMETLEMMGTYAQTEMGHGTHLRGLETTATYNPETEEFIINSPTRTSIKWWPGGVGKTANHVILMAQLITRNTRHGIHLFVVPTRDVETHQPLKGIIVGDIGPKIGFNSTDNGFLQLTNVRIPRTNMLMKSAEVRPDGAYSRKSETDKSSYGTMVLVRSRITQTVSAACLAQAVTIAIRYSCVRRQSELAQNEREPQILDFVTQQYKLFPALAEAFAFHYAGQEMLRIYNQSLIGIQSGDGSELPELHALSSCLKAFTTAAASLSIEQCRLACGGHGFSQASGFQKIYAQCTAAATYEGENTVLYLQTARYLLKSFGRAQAGQPLGGSVVYLTESGPRQAHISKDISLKELLSALKYIAKRKVECAAVRAKVLSKEGHAFHDVWNKTGIELVKASEAHAQCFVMDTFTKVVERIDDRDLQRIMSKLCQLYGCCCLVKNAGTVYEDNYLTAVDMGQIQDKLGCLLEEIRPQAVNLVDAFDFDDHQLGSVLGRYDGQVYEKLFDWAQNSPLNQTDVHPSFEKYIVPFRKELKKSKL